MSGEHPADEPPLESGGSEATQRRLHLLFDHDRNRELLVDWLADTYTVTGGEDPALDETVDCCLVDGRAFAAHREAIATWKEREHPRFAPVLLVAEEPLSEEFAPADWTDIDGLYIVDEVVDVPVEKAVLHRRLENLLERRALSGALSSAFERAEHRFSSLFHATPDPSLIVGEDGHIEYVNDPLCRVLGVEREAVVGLPLSDLVELPREAIETLERVVGNARAGGPVEDREVEFRDASGEVRFAEMNASAFAMPETDGETDRGGGSVAVVMRDVTERREQEAALERSERKFRRTFEATNDALVLADDEGNYLDVNQAACDLYQRDREELLGRNLAEFAPEGFDVDAAWARFIGHGELEGDFPLLLPDGEERILHFSATTNVVPGKHLSALRDITERVERERSLAEAEARFRQIAENVDEVIWMVDGDAETGVYISPGIEELTGLRPEELREDPLDRALEVVHQDDLKRVASTFDKLREARTGDAAPDEYEVECRLESPDGLRWVQITAYPVEADGELSRIVGIVDDITDLKDRERELERQNERLEEFAGIVSHDLRNPLQVVATRVGILEAETGGGEHLAAIQENLARMEHLIDDLLDLAREGQSLDDTETVQLREVASQAWVGVDAPAATLENQLTGVAQADVSRLIQLFENLFRNAVDHGGPTVTIEVGRLHHGFYVADDGPGIPPVDRDAVFEKGYSTTDEGTGYGLSIVAEVADSHGWEVTVTESEDGGARFEVTGLDL